MDLQALTFLIVGFTFAVYVGIAFWARASSTDEFYVAGGDIHPVANGMATAADWMSAASFISMAGLIAFFGYGGSVFLMGWTGGYVLLALLLAPYLRKHGTFTVPGFISDRYYSKTARVVAVVCLIIASVTYVIGQMKGIGVAFSRFLEVDYDQGLMVGMIIVFIYAVMGGMKGITYTQIAQYVIMIIAYTIPAIFISFMLTGNPIPQLGLGGTIKDGTYLLDTLDKIVTDLGFDEYTTHARLSLFNMFFYTLSLMIGTAGLPHVIMRFFTVPSVKAARLSAGWALLFIAILYTTAPAVAAMARLNFITTIDQPGEENNLSYPEFLPLGSSSITISGEPYTYVGITQNGNLLGSGQLDRFGSIDLSLSGANIPGNAQIVGSCQNHQPFFGEILIASPEGPYVMVESSSFTAGSPASDDLDIKQNFKDKL